MAKPTSPSPPHTSKGNPGLHVDIAASGGGKLHVPVHNQAAAYVIGQAQRDGARAAKGK